MKTYTRLMDGPLQFCRTNIQESDITAVFCVFDIFPLDCVHIFNEHGDYLIKFDLHGSYDFRTVAFHRVSQKVVAAGITQEVAFFHMKKSSTQYSTSTVH